MTTRGITFRRGCLVLLWTGFGCGCGAGDATPARSHGMPVVNAAAAPAGSPSSTPAGVEASATTEAPLAERAAEEQPLRRRALLVGCTRYPNLRPNRQLEGPAYDVALMYRLLQERFGFEADEITVLAEPDHLQTALGQQEMTQEIASELPTAAHLRREFERLADAAPGDMICILLAGHGSQQLDVEGDPVTDPEPDGLDELFLPRDVGGWASPRQTVDNVIVDDDIRGWIAKMVRRGGFVFLVADSCHSGTVARGEETGESVRVREVTPGELGVPRRKDSAAPAAMATGDLEPDWLDAAWEAGGASGVVALYGAQSNELAVEFRESDSSPMRGRLTLAVARTLADAQRPLTYRELAQRVLWMYAREDWTSRSTPGIEGTSLDRTVLGLDHWPRRSRLSLLQTDEGYAVNAGTLQGVSVGSLLAVYPPAASENEDLLAGYVEVHDSRLLTSLVVPIAYRDRPAVSELPRYGRCELVYRDPGELQLSVAPAVMDVAEEQQVEQVRARVQDQLSQVAQQSEGLVQLAAPGTTPDWLAVATPEGLCLRRSGSRFASNDPEGVRHGEVLLEPQATRGRADSTPWLRQSLEQIALSTNLRKLAQSAEDNVDPAIAIAVQVMRNGQPFDPGGPASASVHRGDRLALQVTNAGSQPLAIAVLYLDNAYQLQLFFPEPSRPRDLLNNRLGRRESLYREIGFNINDRTLGWEHVLVIAVPIAEKQTIDDLLLLQQPGLGFQTRSADAPSLRSPLGRMIERTGRGVRTRDPDDRDPPIGSYVIRSVSWQVMPSETGAP